MRNALFLLGVVLMLAFVWNRMLPSASESGAEKNGHNHATAKMSAPTMILTASDEKVSDLSDAKAVPSRQLFPRSMIEAEWQISEEIIPWLGTFGPFSREELRQFASNPSFIPRFLEIGLSDKEVRPADIGQGAEQRRKVHFRHNALPQSRDAAIPPDFPIDQKRIYAHFTYHNLPHDQVLVKWSESAENGEVLLFKRYPLITSNQHHYVWFDKDAPWDPGVYRVEIFSADADLTALAAGTYTVNVN